MLGDAISWAMPIEIASAMLGDVISWAMPSAGRCHELPSDAISWQSSLVSGAFMASPSLDVIPGGPSFLPKLRD